MGNYVVVWTFDTYNFRIAIPPLQVYMLTAILNLTNEKEEHPKSDLGFWGNHQDARKKRPRS
ncbi:MAG TPA: hypothetical protein DHU69_10590 [Deltaproteobacteria bacterium]|nr:MAG: hypothetical protein A2090_11880 [Deltaproteobacteria bacterium GWD2_42_10]OGP47573.1 MAG: hypothetical protein A2022_09255 [Deltaproteobacteria bacterium GWF2_42_12]OGQ71961.1 MAG: hypothetical protein A2235_10890 [Deltaproteobacteria bacterium RIFOXYA2_FULL_42_10]HAG49920.1 hypothetical protein [Deltaproteobacteria bacterium]HCY20168.1 hypothetical protein [Deltaproteobacteria bacterium]